MIHSNLHNRLIGRLTGTYASPSAGHAGEIDDVSEAKIKA
jgi:hypothetical protein